MSVKISGEKCNVCSFLLVTGADLLYTEMHVKRFEADEGERT